MSSILICVQSQRCFYLDHTSWISTIGGLIPKKYQKKSINWSWCAHLYIISTIRRLTSGLERGPRYFGETTRISSFKNRYFPISLWNSLPEFRTHISSTWNHQVKTLSVITILKAVICPNLQSWSIFLCLVWSYMIQI